ncbi:hypothetical protein SAMN05444280_15213 [Tangfeifania diversioriginum]|uniref:Actin-binding WH2 domain-containing protein n=1 Tax=Tangfeifania diversioriginum TaxID=1168035 RepID=A0A1M6P5E1_9BACT|nr:hypothetical protein [Tangfeifania diversioriginum]SHK03187.1 hypothetical protein SAMN05444280_15213 [Tangfeifania diversioriginum]
MTTFKRIREVFYVLQDKESYFAEINSKQSNRLIFKQLLIICLFGFIYGLVMGSYHSALQALVAGLKMMVLFITTLLICFPSFFIIQQVLGSKMSFRKMVGIVLSGFVLASTITLSFVPVIIFFQITGNNYHFLQLLHVVVFIFAGFFGMKLILEALKFACDKKNVYPQIGVTVFKVWIVILAFVGIQLSWNLRPFLGDKNEDFKLFRKYQGNFYTAIVYSFDQLFSGQNAEEYDSNKTETNQPAAEQKDTADFSYFLED